MLGGNKGYEWLTSFLGLLQSIRYLSGGELKPDLLMTQTKLKSLTILANLLITHLSMLDRKTTYDFVLEVRRLIDESLMDFKSA